MSGPIALYVNHVEMLDADGNAMEWSLSFEEVLGGAGRATVRIQDKTNSWEPQAHWDVRVVVRSSGWVSWRGEVITPSLDLPPGTPWRTWVLDCSDYNGELPQRLVGAFDGVTWEDVDGLGDYVNVDPFAHSLATDKLTVQSLLDHYVRVDGEAFGTDTYVGEYLTDFFPFYWAYTNVQSALEELASTIAENIQFWGDPDLEYHWVAVPAWQDLAQVMAALVSDPTKATLATLFPEASLQGFRLAPSNVGNGGGGYVRCRDLRFTLDGSAMPEQVYVQGSTGYVYNAAAVDPTGGTIVVNPAKDPNAKAGEKFRLTFLATTRIWSRLSSGYINPTYTTVGASGPFDVKYVSIPVNPANGKGGGYWKLLTGPKKGYYVDNDTNHFNYGEIRVVKIVPITTPPSVGIGGSGWVKEATQDLNKRQTFLQASLSSDVSKRDAFGGQALYRGSQPTLRGSLKVTGGIDADGNLVGPDQWRAGQIFNLVDDRLPSFLNGKYFMIQRVSGNLIPGQDLREYTLDWGDGPTSRYTAQRRSTDDGAFPPPATQIVISVFDLAPGPNSSQTIIGQMVNGLGQPWAVGGKVVKWTLEVYDNVGAIVVGQGTLTPEVSPTDANGRARTVLKTGSRTGLVYFVFADVAAS